MRRSGGPALSHREKDSGLLWRVEMMVRFNYAAWGRNDNTGFETMPGGTATYPASEETARLARAVGA